MNIYYQTDIYDQRSTSCQIQLRMWNDTFWYEKLHRPIEILLCVPFALFLVSIIPLIWFLNKLFSPGPLFYRQRRVGLDGQVFLILKFRSMVIDAEAEGAVWAEEDDPRVTAAGRFMRRLHLDELPQVWNILKGEMSFIGPRPERPKFVTEFERELPGYKMRHFVRPGLTGWAQVEYKYGANIGDATIKLAHDLYYIENRGWWLDMWILIRTVVTVLQFNGR